MSEAKESEALSLLAVSFAEHVGEIINDVTESPIERMLAVAFLADPSWWHVPRFLGDACGASDGGAILAVDDTLCALVAQYPTSKYRLDFAILRGYAPDPRVLRVAIECDGHQFHEATKEQARSDRSRERELMRDGWHVLRFTGSEIYESADACAAEVRAFLQAHDKRAGEIGAYLDSEAFKRGEKWAMDRQLREVAVAE